MTALQENIIREAGPVIHKEIRFTPPALAGWSWPVIEIGSGVPGPRLCVMAGMHVNEVCSMEAALRLPDELGRTILRGNVQIMPVVNLPALWRRTVQLCPIDGRNLNFSFPGDASGGFTPALASALLREWAGDAELLVDMHGGDLQMQVSHFVMCQLTGDAAFDARTRRFARCFDADVVVEFEKGQSENTGRSCNIRPLLGGHAVMSEGGGGGRLAEADVRFHLDGVLNCAAELGIVAPHAGERPRRAKVVSGFHRIAPPENARLYPRVRVGDDVSEGDVLAELRDIWGRPLEPLFAPASGPVVYCLGHPIARSDEPAIAIGRLSRHAEAQSD